MGTQERAPGLVVLVVDDETAGLNEMKHMLGDNSRVGRILAASDAAEALRMLRSDNPELAERGSHRPIVDAVFADVVMPGLSGLELARVLTAFANPPALVFLTAHGENALEAFEIGAVDYIMKPANEERIDRALKKVETAVPEIGAVAPPSEPEPARQGDDEVIPVELAGTTKLVPRSHVRWVEAQGDYARLHTRDGSHLVRIPLSQLEEKWSEVGFVRIHRSYLVSLSLISELRMSSSGYSVLLAGGELRELPVSRRHTRELKNRLVRAPRLG